MKKTALICISLTMLFTSCDKGKKFVGNWHYYGEHSLTIVKDGDSYKMNDAFHNQEWSCVLSGDELDCGGGGKLKSVNSDELNYMGQKVVRVKN